MHREQAQHEHDKYMPVCHGRVEQDTMEQYHGGERGDETINPSGLIAGPWYCPDCDWQEGKRADSLLPDLGTGLPNVETH